MNPQIRRLALDLGPLLVFFAAFRLLGIYAGTACFMAAVLAALGIGWWLEKKLSPMPLFTAVLVVIFGGLTLYLKNEDFIKIKVTVLYGFFSAVLLGGLMFNRLFIKYVFNQAFELNDAGWKKLTIRWAVFFALLAVLNELVWRHTSTATWVTFKVWGIMAMLVLFAAAQAPLVTKHQPASDENSGKDAQD
jgi:intracellular septation protein